ncbi:MAG: stage V sporulation protein AD [Acetatifactor sp.]
MAQRLGKTSYLLEKPVFVENSASVVGTKEGQGPLGPLFDMVGEDDLFQTNNWEEAESTLQKSAVHLALKKAGCRTEDVQCMFAGDLLGQSIATSFGVGGFGIPLFGLYGACSTCGESMILGAMAISGGFAERVICVTSSHFASAEKEFRFPLEYGNQRPLSASWTVTGSGAFLLGTKKEEARARIAGMTVGKIVDYGLKDSMNMGACMAPAAADTIERHMKEFGRTPQDYDRIITGDLGCVGQKALIELLRDKHLDISAQHMDCGIEIYDGKEQDTHAGGSGCGCCAATLSAYILKRLEEPGGWNRVLFLPTGALLSKVSFNEGRTVPGISHGLVLERIS